MSDDFKNPIDPDNITETPGTLPYAHHRGSVVIKPNKEGVVKSRALSAMEEQTNMQLDQIKQQIELLAKQAQEINSRKEISLKIYSAKMNFTPLINHVYYLYENGDETTVLSMIGPNEWGRSKKFHQFLAKIRLLADHTWKEEE